jgi:exo-1,4-beta-D-glucosaminidase
VSRFSSPWWYRAELPAAATPHPPLLDFHGLNYRADVFVDGAQVAGADEIVGPFRRFILPLAQSPRPNAAVAVRIWRQHDRALPPGNNDTDLGISFVDWAPAPPDGNLGLFRPVQLLSVASANVRLLLDYLAVAVTLVSPVEAGVKEADLNVEVSITAYNFEDQLVHGRMDIAIAGVQVTVEHVAIPPSPHGVTLVFNQTHAPRLANVGPLPLWWPWRMGAQTFVNCSVSFSAANVSNEGPHASADAVLGLRQASASVDAHGNRLFYVNGHRFMVYGGGYSPDLFLRRPHSWQARHLRMARDLGLNALRLEGKMEDDAFYNEADRLGLLVLTGWCCCDAWQHWPLWHSEQYHVANASLQTQVRRLRTHSSAIAFLYGSDEAPPPPVEDSFLTIFREEGWRAATLAAASALSTPGAGPTGVKMAGPYAW